MKNTIHILVGLPGSGKTYFAKNFVMENPNIHFISEDEIKKKQLYSSSNITYEIELELKRCFSRNSKPDILIDSLFLTNKSIIDLLKKFNKYANDYNVVLHIWNEDREICVKNDAGRRNLGSKQTILNIPYEEIDISLLQSKLSFNISIKKHIVKLKENWKQYLDTKQHFMIKNGCLISSKWCLGGVTGNYNGDSYPVSADPQPDFEELDELLEMICPNITYLQYKKLSKNCIKIEEEEEYEYYGSHYTYAHYECDLDIFSRFLKDMNIPNNLDSLKIDN